VGAKLKRKAQKTCISSQIFRIFAVQLRIFAYEDKANIPLRVGITHYLNRIWTEA
jgi:hypothetical protein